MVGTKHSNHTTVICRVFVERHGILRMSGISRGEHNGPRSDKVCPRCARPARPIVRPSVIFP